MSGEQVSAEVERFYEDLERDELQGLWRVVRGMKARRPTSPVVPFHWSWTRIRTHLQSAARLIDLTRGGDRRVLLLVNPGLKDQHLTTPTLIASVQIMRPGEVAPAHRHSPTAIRFIIEGDGAFTTVEGEQIMTNEHDLVLTPSLTWHNHGNPTDRPIVWIDGIDAPLVNYLAAQFYDEYPTPEQPVTRAAGYSQRKYGAGILRPSSVRGAGGPSPLLHYRWDDTYQALRDLAEIEHDPHDGVLLEYVNPLTGGRMLPTIGCRIQLLSGGMVTQAHRHTGHVVYHVVQGSGATTIDDQRYEWKVGDFFVIPPWARHSHESASGGDAILFSMSDIPILEALGLYHEEAKVDEPAATSAEERASRGRSREPVAV